jgi:hypothetical protein
MEGHISRANVSIVKRKTGRIFERHGGVAAESPPRGAFVRRREKPFTFWLTAA